MKTYIYVTSSAENKINILSLDKSTGEISKISELKIPGKPAPLALSVSKRFLYIGRRGIPDIACYKIDQSDGSLIHIGENAKLPSDPNCLWSDRKGNFLFSSYYEGKACAVHKLNANGSVEQNPIEWISTAKGAHSMQADPSNKYVFVPHISGGNGPNQIWQFIFNEHNGKLSPNVPPQFSPNEELGPRHYVFQPKMPIIYFSNEQDSSISAYHMSTQTGTLKPFQKISNLPENFNGENSCAQIQITQNGKFLFAPNRGHNSVASYSINPNDGTLRSIGHTNTDPVPRAIMLDNFDQHLFAAGLNTGNLFCFKIDQETGDLNKVSEINVGLEPMWIIVNDIE